MLKRLSSRWPLLVVTLTLLVVFHRLLLGEVLFWGLPALQFYPWREFMADSLRAGQLPLWNPYNGAGAPLIANYQSALFYPLHWPQLIVPSPLLMSVTAVLHLLIAAWGMYAFTGRLGLPTLGRGVSALAFGLSGYLVARLGTFPVVAAASWMPWVLWAALGVLTQTRRRDVALLAFVAALQLLSGHAQTTWYSMLLVGLFSLFYGLRHRRAWQPLVLVIGGLTLAAGIAAVQLLPTAELLRTSQRSGGVDYAFAMNFSYAPARALNLLSPDVFGNPGDGSYVTKGAFFEDAVYIGLLPLVSAIVAALAWVNRRLRRNPENSLVFSTVPFWLVIAILAFIFALGRYTGVFPFFFRSVPTFNLFQAPVRWHIWTVFALSVLAGIGTQVWGRGKWLFFGTRLAVAGCIGAALLAVFVAPQFLQTGDESAETLDVLVKAVVYTGLFGALAGALTLLQPDRDTARYGWWTFGVLLIIAIDLGWASRGLNPTVPAAFYDDPQPSTETTRAYWPAHVESDVMYETYLQFDDYRVAGEQWQDFRASQLPNLNLREHRYLLNNFDPLRVGHFAAYIDLIEMNDQNQSTLLAAAAVGAIYTSDGERAGSRVQPRAWFVESACGHADTRSLTYALAAPDWQPHRQAHLLAGIDCPALPTRANPRGMVLALREGHNALEIDVQTELGGWLVVADTDYPGWSASVDGLIVPITRANLAFRVVEVPAGAQTVRFDYRPGWLLPGVLVTVVALLVMIVLFRTRRSF
jgi:hypothetical protein